MPPLDTDVLVVGAGPVGLTASALLARDGVDAVTVTKHAGTHPTPRAVYTNQRTMEILRDLGIEDEARRAGVPIDRVGGNVWATSFPGVELARMPAWGTGLARRADYEAASPSRTHTAPQHVLEPILLAAARRLGADVRFGTELTGIEQDGDGVTATVRDRETGAERALRARYAIGADGGRSTVAARSGFAYEGETGIMNWAANVWLEADLTQYCAHRPALMYCVYEPGEDFHSNTWICIRPWSEWVMSIIFSGSRDRPGLDGAEALAYARRMIADTDVPVRIKGISTWSVDKGLATEYRRGRIFLAGDAAHRHPPPNGLGSNTGVQDAYNLCWKLAKVLNGQAGPALLDTYHAERRPVGERVVDRAMQSLLDMEPMVDALGLHPDLDAQAGWAKLDELAAADGRGRKRRAMLREALELQEYHYNAHGVEYGQRYDVPGAAVVADGGEPPEPVRDPQLYYQPSTYPGHPLPHAWVQRDGTPLSTLDLAGRGEFTLITGIGGELWLDAAAQASAALGVPIATAVVDYRREYHDPCGDWAALREIDETGCLLVRPDRHIAWRADARPAEAAEAEAALADALRRVLARG
ncbi:MULTISPECIES: FAD-dependent monooxygenase [Actinomadura]|uniref:FAD-dependent monooxygenase n=1 Tax=Actinomadura yumaensis TaxID=111807 RepID=A0ABW2CKJ3_9ACTN|nr:FAD-dependent monooxygenase [Actinomadura sp. J1-007]MWK36842.1 2,4-dichlorophenol 6-monooxygenase [Actinomadura sp. J1-007]